MGGARAEKLIGNQHAKMQKCTHLNLFTLWYVQDEIPQRQDFVLCDIGTYNVD